MEEIIPGWRYTRKKNVIIFTSFFWTIKVNLNVVSILDYIGQQGAAYILNLHIKVANNPRSSFNTDA